MTWLSSSDNFSGHLLLQISNICVCYCQFPSISGQNINGKMSLPKNPKEKTLAPTSKNQTHKSVTFYTLSFCPWHSDRTPFPSHHNNDIAYEIIVYGANERSRTKAGQLPNTLSHFGCSTRKSKQNLSAHPFQIQLYLNHTTTLSLL